MIADLLAYHGLLQDEQPFPLTRRLRRTPPTLPSMPSPVLPVSERTIVVHVAGEIGVRHNDVTAWRACEW